MTLVDLAYRETERGRRFAYPDFGADLITVLHEHLPKATSRGLLRRTQICPFCEASLEGVPIQPVRVELRLPLDRIPPLGLEVEMPGRRCPGLCGRGLVVDDRDVDSDMSDALIAAFDAAGVRPG